MAKAVLPDSWKTISVLPMAFSDDQIFPPSFYHLDDKAKAKYKEKLQMLGGLNDPYVESASAVSSVDCHK